MSRPDLKELLGQLPAEPAKWVEIALQGDVEVIELPGGAAAVVVEHAPSHQRWLIPLPPAGAAVVGRKLMRFAPKGPGDAAA